MKISVAFAVACLAVGMSFTAESNASIKKYDLNIPRQTLDTALKDLAQQTGLQIARMSDTIDGAAMVGPVTGSLTTEQALKSLLNAQGLGYKVVNDRTIAIVKSGAETAENHHGTTRSVKVSEVVPTAVRLAQNNQAAENPETKNSSSSESSAADPDSSELQEIVVTAQKREERLQEVPISISVVSGEELDRSTLEGTTEVLNRIPGVKLTIGSIGSPIVSMRGVSTAAGASTSAFYVDSVPFGAARNGRIFNVDIYDMERIEVLRGPQGTLYGANALNGVIRVLSKDPELGKFDLKSRGVLSSTADGGENYRGSLALNVPLVSDKLAARITADYSDWSGWIDKPNDEDANDASLKNLRLKLGAQPTEALSLVASAWMSRNDFGEQSIGRLDRTNSVAEPEPYLYDYNLFGLRATYEFSGFTLSSSTSLIDYKNYSQLTWALFNIDSLQFSKYDLRTFSEELVLSSKGEGPWRLTAGTMYRDNKDRYRRTFDYTRVVPITELDYNDISKSIAVFGELTRTFFDRKLELTAGLRFFHDDYDYEENKSYTGDPATPLFRAGDSFESTTPRVVLTWLPSDAFTAYASYSEGFRSGLTQLPETINRFNLFGASGVRPLKEDRLQNYEVGSKANLWGGMAGYDIAVYYIDWQDPQSALSIPIFNNGTAPFVTALVNAGSISGAGVDFALTLRPARGLTLGANYSHNDLRYDTDIFSGGVATFLKGSTIGSPRTTYGAFAEYAFPVGRFTGRLGASLDYISEGCTRGFQGANIVTRCGDPLRNSRASFSVESDGRWSAILFAENLRDQNDRLNVIPGFPDWDNLVRPRTIGVQVEYRVN